MYEPLEIPDVSIDSSKSERIDLATRTLAQIDLEPELISRINFKDIAFRLGNSLKALDDAKDQLGEVKDAEWHIKFWNSLTGKNYSAANTAQEALLQSTKVMGELLLVNCLLSKALREQQEHLLAQQGRIAEHQATLEEQDQALSAQGERILEFQREVKSVIQDRLSETQSQVDELRSSFRHTIASFQAERMEILGKMESVSMRAQALEDTFAGEATRLSQDLNAMTLVIDSSAEKAKAQVTQFNEATARRIDALNGEMLRSNADIGARITGMEREARRLRAITWVIGLVCLVMTTVALVTLIG